MLLNSSVLVSRLLLIDGMLITINFGLWEYASKKLLRDSRLGMRIREVFSMQGSPCFLE